MGRASPGGRLPPARPSCTAPIVLPWPARRLGVCLRGAALARHRDSCPATDGSPAPVRCAVVAPWSQLSLSFVFFSFLLVSFFETAPLAAQPSSAGFYNLTRDWLIRHGFPPGPIALTEHIHLAALPGKARQHGFKKQSFKNNALEHAPAGCSGQGARPGAGGRLQAPVYERAAGARPRARRRVRQHADGCASVS